MNKLPLAVLLLAAPVHADFLGSMNNSVNSGALQDTLTPPAAKTFVSEVLALRAYTLSRQVNPAVSTEIEAEIARLARAAGCAKSPSAPRDCIAAADTNAVAESREKIAELRKIMESWNMGSNEPKAWLKWALDAHMPAINGLGARAAALEPELGDYKKQLAGKMDIYTIGAMQKEMTALDVKVTAEQKAAAADAAFEPQFLDAARAFTKAEQTKKLHPSLLTPFDAEALKIAKIAGCKKFPAAAADCAGGGGSFKDAVAALKPLAASLDRVDFTGPIKDHWKAVVDGDKTLPTLGDSEFLLEPDLTDFKKETAGNIDVYEIGKVADEWNKLSAKFPKAAAQAKYTADAKADLAVKAAAVNAAINETHSLPAQVRAEFVKRMGGYAATGDCKRRCDDAWLSGVHDAAKNLAAMPKEIQTTDAGFASARAEADKLRPRVLGMTVKDQARVRPMLDGVYAALAAGPLDKVQTALERLNDELGRMTP